MIPPLLQLLLIALTLAGLVIFGLIRDKHEHSSTNSKNGAHESLPFAALDSPGHEHRGTAISRL